MPCCSGQKIGKNLLGTGDEGLSCTPNEDKGLEVFTDFDFASRFNMLKIPRLHDHEQILSSITRVVLLHGNQKFKRKYP